MAVMTFCKKKKHGDYSPEVFREMQRRRETRVNSDCSRGRGSMSLTARRCERRSERAIPIPEPTGKQFLARLDLCVRLDANDDLPTGPSAVLPNPVGTSLTGGAVRSAKCPQ
jgi:hypothetical protein